MQERNAGTYGNSEQPEHGSNTLTIPADAPYCHSTFKPGQRVHLTEDIVGNGTEQHLRDVRHYMIKEGCLRVLFANGRRGVFPLTNIKWFEGAPV